MLENLAALTDPAPHLCGYLRVFGDAQGFTHAIIVDARPVAILGDEADREWHIQVRQRIAERFEGWQVGYGRHILDAEEGAVVFLMINPKHVVEQVCKGERAILECR